MRREIFRKLFLKLSKKTNVQTLLSILFFFNQNHVVESHFKGNVLSKDRRDIVLKQKLFYDFVIRNVKARSTQRHLH